MAEPYAESGLGALLAEYGVTLLDGIVIEADPRGTLFGDPVSPVVAQFPAHKITNGLLPVVFASVKPLELADDTAEGISLSPLALTSQRSWAKMGALDPSGGLQFEEGKDLEGPVALAAVVYKAIASGSASGAPGTVQAAADEPRSTRLVVLGDADFGSNQYLPQSGNAELLMNSVNWLAEEESLISIRPRSRASEFLNLTGADQTVILLLTVVLMPGVMLLAALATYLRRR
jgi:ABC-type uncharacterized transport system involved in gliding motility auxiliary subunit